MDGERGGEDEVVNDGDDVMGSHRSARVDALGRGVAVLADLCSVRKGRGLVLMHSKFSAVDPISFWNRSCASVSLNHDDVSKWTESHWNAVMRVINTPRGQ